MTSPNLRRVQSDLAHRNQAMRELDALPWAPRASLNLRALGWSVVVVVIAAFLLGLLVVGPR